MYTYLPFEEIEHDERYKLITARHVLSHQTGFPNWASMNPDGKIDIKFIPGTAYGYSGEGYEYLKRVVTKVTGKDIETILKEEVLDPLSLKNTYFSVNDYLKNHGVPNINNRLLAECLELFNTSTSAKINLPGGSFLRRKEKRLFIETCES